MLTGHVLVTGAGGSLGREVSRQLMAHDLASLLVLDHSEVALHDLMETLAAPFPIVPALTDVRDEPAIARLLEGRPLDLIIHAAALKHVPLLETPHNAIEGLRTNVLGTDVMLRTGARTVVVSTDKAVAPTSWMGVTKRLAELVTATYPNGSVVRFGNLYASSGSVVPVFERQIAAGGPVTVTDPRMTRYFMPLEQAASTLLDTVSLRAGRTYVVHMGEPVRIVDLARRMIGERDIPIVYSGIRPGEKLVEQLAYADETLTPTRIPGVSSCAMMKTPVQALVAKLRQGKDVGLLIRALVPDYADTDPWWP